jgi:TonB-dependent starch-binding outer membrane protein SusC
MAGGRQLLLTLLGVLLGATTLVAQGPTGTVTGRVIDGATLQPLEGVTVTIAERGALTRADGRYLIVGVPAGPQTLRARVIGYAEASLSVVVQADQTLTVDVVLSAQALELQDLVVIGYGERRQRDMTGVVQSVTSSEFNTGRVISPEELIQGKVAGLQVIDTGEPGGGISIRIRGGTSVNASNEPLIVIDGVPMPTANRQSGNGGLSAGRNPFAFVNPEDIESITVLKDAAAAAIYGANAANGVLIITTKRGSPQAPRFSYSSSASASSIVRGPNMLNAQQFRDVVAEHAPNRVSMLGDSQTDWQDAVLRTGAGQEHALVMAGARDNMTYRASLGYLGQRGIIRGSMTERISGSLNYSHYFLDQRLNLRANLRGARTHDDFTPGGGLGTATVYDPTQPIRTESGYYEREGVALTPANPVAELAQGSIDGTTTRGVGSLELAYQTPFLEGTTATLRLARDVARSERLTIMPPEMFWQQQQGERAGYWGRSRPRETSSMIDTYVNHERRFGLGSSFDATGGYSYSIADGEYPFSERFGTVNPEPVEEVERFGGRETKLASFFGRTNITLNDRYLVTLSVRRDGSSRFGPANQWGTFPAAAVAWRLSEEPFLPLPATVSDLKLRASWGINGNQAIGDYLWAPVYQPGDEFTQVQFGEEFVRTIRPSAVDPNIRWEETTSYNFGIDLGVFDDRITGSAEYYLKNTDDLLFVVPVAAGLYVSNTVLTNIGSVRNQGFELTLNARVLDGSRGGLGWTAGLNAATNRNELIAVNPVAGGSEQILTGGIAGGVGSMIQVLQPGHPLNSFFVYRHRRAGDGRPIFSDQLLDMYEDINGDGIINQNDRVPFRNPAPTWMFGHTSRFDYRHIDLGFTLRAHLGNWVYNNIASSQGYYNRLNEQGGPYNLHASVLENGFQTAQYFSDYYVEDASFLRMDNITLGYTFPRLRGQREIRVSGTVQNAFTLTGYSGVDPEAGLGGIDNNIYPRSRTFTAGVNVNF